MLIKEGDVFFAKKNPFDFSQNHAEKLESFEMPLARL